MIVADQQFLDRLSNLAAESPRLRKNHNLHPSDDFCCHRLFNAMEPGSYIRPHRHLDPLKDETFVWARGRIGIITFDDTGTVIGKVLLSHGGTVAVDIPHGVFHTAVCLERGSVFFEAKAGPYVPVAEKEKAPWAPEEGTPEAAAYLVNLEKQFL